MENGKATGTETKTKGTDSIFIAPGSPWQNGKCESFNGKLRDEYLNAQWFRTLREAKLLIEMWRKEYNNYRPHRSLGYATPLEFDARWNSTISSASLQAVIWIHSLYFWMLPRTGAGHQLA
jgi:putative transposase